MMDFTAVVSHSADDFIEILRNHFDILSLPADVRLDAPVASHADMNMFVLGNSAVLPRNYSEEYSHIEKHLRDVCGLNVILSDGIRKREYPHDIMLNVLVCGNVAFSLEKHTCNEVKDLLQLNGVELLNVRQGYAACSTLAFGKQLISADKNILRAGAEKGIECLEISSGGISLEGYNEGFIGGASGVCEDTVYFTGNLLTHPDGEKILRFIEKGGFKINNLSDGKLRDVGGIKFVKNVKFR